MASGDAFNVATLQSALPAIPSILDLPELIGTICLHVPFTTRVIVTRVCKKFHTERFIQAIFSGKEDKYAARCISSAITKNLPFRYSYLPYLVTKVKTLNLSGSQPSFEQLGQIEAFFKNQPLSTLIFSSCAFGEAHLEKIAAVTSVKKLILRACELTDSSLEKLQTLSNLSHLTNLESLNLYGNKEITGSTLDHLSSSLRKLALSYCNVGNAQVKNLRQFALLERADLTGNKEITLPTFSKRLTRLQWLSPAQHFSSLAML